MNQREADAIRVAATWKVRLGEMERSLSRARAAKKTAIIRARKAKDRVHYLEGIFLVRWGRQL